MDVDDLDDDEEKHWHWCPHKHHHDTRSVRVSTSAKIGQTFTFVAVNDDASGNVDPNAIDSWAEVDSTGAPASTGFIGPLTPGTPSSTATASAVAAGSGFVAATGSDPDGNAVVSPPYPFTVLADTDVTQVIVSGSAA